MQDLNLLEMSLRLAAALVLGGLIGLEREAHERPAGLRTHVLVCVGAALFTLCSYKIAGVQFDPGRVTAQIVTGIGFLGAGTIIRQGSVVRGLTTAASIWTVAAIGIAAAIGGDMMLLAAIASVLVFSTLTGVRYIEGMFLARSGERGITLTVRAGHEPMVDALSVLAERGQLRRLAVETGPEPSSQIVRARLRVPPDFDQTMLDAELASCQNVLSYTWE